MGIRESLNEKPWLTTGIAVIVTGAAVLYIIWLSIFGNTTSFSSARSAFYSFDDGQTWFVDDISKAAPFRKDGREAVRIHLYSTDGGKTKVPLYLEKFTEKGLKIYESSRADENDIPAMISAQERLQRELLIKRPGETKWYPRPHFDFVSAFVKERFKDDPNAGEASEVLPD